MRFLPHAHRISLLSPAPVSHIFHSCRPSMPRKQKAASVPTPIKQSHKAMVVSYRPQTLHDTIHTVLPGEVLPAIPSYSEFIAVRLFVFQLTASRRDWRRSTPRQPTSAAFQLTASRRGWRCWDIGTSKDLLYFNSQPHEEADCLAALQYGIFGISTHSLTKRLTVQRLQNIASMTFQLTASRRGWPTKTVSVKWNSVFQLTASRRGWLCVQFGHPSCRYFNSQPHEEADPSQLYGSYRYPISTHSLTKRLT